jgi:hypothetical protein
MHSSSGLLQAHWKTICQLNLEFHHWPEVPVVTKLYARHGKAECDRNLGAMRGDDCSSVFDVPIHRSEVCRYDWGLGAF